MSDWSRFAGIREFYKRELPKMLAEYAETGRTHFDPYGLDFTADMTPIEASVWSDIRGEGLPFYPQIPALNYFLDFADPFKKIAIECDGKEWHDAGKDAKRDARLLDDGWTVYRIPGWKCRRLMKHPHGLVAEEIESGYTRDEALRLVADHAREWFASTSEGIVRAIGISHYGKADMFAEFGKRVAEQLK